MSQAFTHYWNKSSWEESMHENGRPMNHVASNVFSQRGVEPDDRVYVVTIQKGELFLLGRMEVGQVVDYAYADASLDYTPWDASDHLLASTCTSMRFDRSVSRDIAERLRFEGAKGPTTLKFKGTGVLDEQTLRGVRRLTDASAALFDTLLAREPVHTPVWPEVELPEDEENSALEVLIEYCEEMEYPYEIEDNGALTIDLDMDGDTYSVHALGMGPLLSLSVFLPDVVPEGRRAAVAETIVRANTQSCLHTFNMYFDNGVMCCDIVCDNRGGMLDTDVVGDDFVDLFKRAGAYLDPFRAVVAGTQTPAEAVAAAEAFYNAS